MKTALNILLLRLDISVLLRFRLFVLPLQVLRIILLRINVYRLILLAFCKPFLFSSAFYSSSEHFIFHVSLVPFQWALYPVREPFNLSAAFLFFSSAFYFSPLNPFTLLVSLLLLLRAIYPPVSLLLPHYTRVQILL